MRLYESSDANFYINVRNGWDTYCRYPKNKSWARKRPLPQKWKVWNTYIDLDGSRKLRIKDEDLYFECWEPSRVDPHACLPRLYAVGDRFIKLEQAPPHGYRCAMMPMNLYEAREKKAFLKACRDAKRRRIYLRKMWLTQCQKKDDRVRRSEPQIALREKRRALEMAAWKAAICTPRCPNLDIFRIGLPPKTMRST